MEKDLEYWKKRCLLAETYIENSPCDPYTYKDQLDSYYKWRDFKNHKARYYMRYPSDTTAEVVVIEHDKEKILFKGTVDEANKWVDKHKKEWEK